MPTWGFNRPDLLLLGTGCILGPAIPYRREGGGAGLRGGGAGGPEALPVPEGKVQADLRYFEVEGHSGQRSTTRQLDQAAAGASRDAGGWR